MSVNPLEQIIFGVYEILADILPGSIILVTILLRTNLQYFELLPESISLLLFIFLSFVIGQVIHYISSVLEGIINNRKFGGYPSTKLMQNEDETFPRYFKDAIRKKLNADYGMPLDSSSQHIFDMCYTFVVQNKLSNRVMIFLNMYTFSRNVMVTMGIEGILLAIWAYYDSSIYIGLYAFLSLWSTYFFYKRFLRYASSFSEEVFRSYFVHNINQ